MSCDWRDPHAEYLKYEDRACTLSAPYVGVEVCTQIMTVFSMCFSVPQVAALLLQLYAYASTCMLIVDLKESIIQLIN